MAVFVECVTSCRWNCTFVSSLSARANVAKRGRQRKWLCKQLAKLTAEKCTWMSLDIVISWLWQAALRRLRRPNTWKSFSRASQLTCPPNRPASGVFVKFPLSGHKYSSKSWTTPPLTSFGSVTVHSNQENEHFNRICKKLLSLHPLLLHLPSLNECIKKLFSSCFFLPVRRRRRRRGCGWERQDSSLRQWISTKITFLLFAD